MLPSQPIEQSGERTKQAVEGLPAIPYRQVDDLDTARGSRLTRRPLYPSDCAMNDIDKQAIIGCLLVNRCSEIPFGLRGAV